MDLVAAEPSNPATQYHGKGDSPRKVSVVEVTRNGGGGAFHPFKKEKSTAGGDGTATPPSQGPLNRPLPPASTSSTAETGGGGNKKEAKEGQSQRKARRCWSPELHRRFLQALQQLGGSHVATPKQIRELMKVDGLTNDEVKSHLQKYRLHTRRPNPSIHNNNNSNAQTPQFVVVGGIWVPPPEYAAMATTSTSEEAAGVAASKGIYTPVAALPPPFQESPASSKQRQHKTCSHSDDRGSNSTEGGVQSCTRSTSSSTHTATA
ncbi:Transcription factor HHO3 [Sesamum angolense]|uniref:Transcription factor HHO3 n=1 Tax=Sesamum angolense TaxID=2727404 RepID=A0AAE2C618_9LAMI|nr:Transcription factor HHO3 [Sesamum angolense]